MKAIFNNPDGIVCYIAECPQNPYEYLHHGDQYAQGAFDEALAAAKQSAVPFENQTLAIEMVTEILREKERERCRRNCGSKERPIYPVPRIEYTKPQKDTIHPLPDQYEVEIKEQLINSRVVKEGGIPLDFERTYMQVVVLSVKQEDEKNGMYEAEDKYRWPAIVSEDALREARERHKATSIDGKSEFSLAWRLCLEWVEKHYNLTRKESLKNK